MRSVHTGCWGCRYNGYGGICKKDGTCDGVEHFLTYTSTSTSPSYIPKSEPLEEIEVGGIRYRRVESEKELWW